MKSEFRRPLPPPPPEEPEKLLGGKYSNNSLYAKGLKKFQAPWDSSGSDYDLND